MVEELKEAGSEKPEVTAGVEGLDGKANDDGPGLVEKLNDDVAGAGVGVWKAFEVAGGGSGV